MTLPSFATLKVLVTVALLAAAVGVSTQGQAQVSVYHEGVDGVDDGVDTDGLIGLVGKKAEDYCGTPQDGFIHLGYLEDVTTFPGTLERTQVVNWGDSSAYMSLSWPSAWIEINGQRPDYSQCVQGIRLKVEIRDTTEAPFCKPTVKQTFKFETSERKGSGGIYWMELGSTAPPYLEVVYYGTDGAGAPSLEDIAPDDGALDLDGDGLDLGDDRLAGDRLAGDGLVDTSGITKLPCARTNSIVQVKACGWYLNKARTKWLPIPTEDGRNCKSQEYVVQTPPGSSPMY